MNILLVDDAKESRMLIEKILTCAGYESVHFATSAHEAYEMLGLDEEGDPEGGKGSNPYKIDLILMDLFMPPVDGIEATRHIKRFDNLRDIPIIIITAIGDLEVLEAAFEAGAMDYITKPLNSTELLARVRSALTLKKEIDQRKSHADELKKLSFVVAQSPSQTIITDPDGAIEYINSACTKDLGYSEEEVLGSHFKSLFHSDHGPAFFDSIWSSIKRGNIWRGDISFKKSDGSPISELQSISPIKNKDGVITNVVSVMVDDTGRKATEAALKEKSHQLHILSTELHDLTMEMSDLEEKERKNFAAILHENIGQHLTVINLAWSHLLKLLPKNEETMESAEEIQSLLEETIKTTRAITSELYPSVPTGLEIKEVLSWYGDSFLKHNNVKTFIDIDPGTEELSEGTRELILKLVKESIQNSIKHADPSEVDVKVYEEHGSLKIKVEDNGRGFSEDGPPRKRDGGIGLILMRERVKEHRGTLNIESSPEGGTSVNISIPPYPLIK